MERLNINSLKNGKSFLTIDAQPEKLDVQDVVSGKITGSLEVNKRGNVIDIKGKIKYTLKLTCSRCLEEFYKEMEEELHLILKKGKERIFREKALTDEDFDTVYIISDIFDISPYLHDVILLSIPLKPLCREDCKGLCPICGKNLNEGPCEHVQDLVLKRKE